MYDRPAQLNRESLVDWTLSVNGVPFEGHHHQLKAGSSVHLTGKITPTPDAIPPLTIPQFLIAFRPIEEDADEDWTALTERTSHMEVFAFILRNKDVDAKVPLDAKWLPPGGYHARLYFRIVDHRNGESHADLIATSKFTIESPDSEI